MTDQTGGNPRAFDKMQAGLLEALEYAKTDGMTHVTIPTGALTELLAAAEECAGDLADEASIKYPHADTNRTEERLYERDMAPVRRLRAAVARVRGE